MSVEDNDGPDVGSPYRGYLYGYPHKTAYRRLSPPHPLAQVWAQETRAAPFLYLHVPFCEMRCGFCNLFTVTDARAREVEPVLAAMERQGAVMRDILGPTRFAQMAIGGGTPTLLAPQDLSRLFRLAESLGAPASAIPTSVEASPATATSDRLAILAEEGVRRVSLGVQSFFARETRALGRPQRGEDARAALERIRRFDFATLNIDLIYGVEGQSGEDFVASIRIALEYAPEEIYLYPLYVRPLTGLSRHKTILERDAEFDRDRLRAYRAGRDFLRAHGYEQVSMRMFRRSGGDRNAPVHVCQEDAMLGIGPGARSYTRRLHYSSEYAVSRAGLLAIIRDYVRRDEKAFAFAEHGIALDALAERRRYLILSILQAAGLPLADYRARYGLDLFDAEPRVAMLIARGLAVLENGVLRLTESGLERADSIGPWLVEDNVRHLMEGFRWAV